MAEAKLDRMNQYVRELTDDLERPRIKSSEAAKAYVLFPRANVRCTQHADKNLIKNRVFFTGIQQVHRLLHAHRGPAREERPKQPVLPHAGHARKQRRRLLRRHVARGPLEKRSSCWGAHVRF